jgi:hypothetical protein
MRRTVEAIYIDGKIEIKEVPRGIRRDGVLVTFLEEDDRKQNSNTSEHKISGELRKTFDDIPERHSIAAELISERRAEADRIMSN